MIRTLDLQISSQALYYLRYLDSINDPAIRLI